MDQTNDIFQIYDIYVSDDVVAQVVMFRMVYWRQRSYPVYNFRSTYDKGQPGTSGEMPRIVAGGDVTDAGDTVSWTW